MARKIGEILIEKGVITEDQLQEALSIQAERPGRKIGEILIKQKYITESELKSALAEQFGLPFLPHIDISRIPEDAVNKIPINYARKNEVIPVEQRGNVVVIAISDPTNVSVVDDLQVLLGTTVIPVVATSGEISNAINNAYNRATNAAGEMIEDLEGEELGTVTSELEEGEPADLLDSVDEAPIIRLVNSLLFQAVKQNVSDIHIEPFEKDVSIRYRIDGVLHNILKIPRRFHSSVVSRVKIMAGLNIAEKRLPQDGRIRTKVAGKDVDIRVSTIPTIFGERVVMRILDRSSVLLGLEEIGLSGDKLEKFKKLLRRSNGIILVTGPTGSGKTTTLYAALNKINSEDKNIMTIEDPVEYQLKGISQIQVNPKINLTFAAGLRSILRQDPDVVLVGEIRDFETAEIAIQASLTGHLVFSTLHTNDAPSAVTRLIDMGVEPYLISSSLVAVLAQRLVRTICPHCKVEYEPTDAELREIGIKREDLKNGKLYRGQGCEYCMYTGYRGRTGIFELFIVSDRIRKMITQKKDASEIRKAAIEEGMSTLKEDGARKVIEGITTIEEVLRVTQEEVV